MTEIAAREDDMPPEKVEGSVIFFAYAAIICAAIMSVTLNVYHDVQPATHSLFHLPKQIAVMVGVLVPSMCVFISHVAAKIPTNNWVKGWLFALTGTLMYVSATAGTKTLTPVTGLGPALAVSIGVDATAMTFLGVLMFVMARKIAVAEWEATAADRERRAAIEALAARQAPRATRGNTGGNAAPAAGGNTPVPSEENAPAAPAGNGALSATLTVGSRETPSGDDPEGEGSGLATVSPLRRPVVTDDEIEMLAVALADELALTGRQLSVRAYRSKYGGKASRVCPIIAKVKAEREGENQAAGAGW